MAQERDTSINIYFKTNSFELDTLQFQKLQNFSSTFRNIKYIIGFADSTGNVTYNLLLSKKRAINVFAVLQTENDSLNQNVTSFRGESSAHPEIWMNRRVQITARLSHPTVLIKNPVDKQPDTASNFYLEYVYFKPDKPIITDESLTYIQELAKNLKTYKTETFEIIGHINYQSRFDSTHLSDLYQLSELRAKAVYDNLIELGIPKTRMTFRGVGNSKPVYPSPVNDDQRKKNMRVQIIVKK